MSQNQNRPSNDREVISELTTGRLSVYLRCLTYLESLPQKTVSSHEMAQRFHLNSAQIRKDLACFGEFGTRGVGYNVSQLKEHLIRELGIDRTRNVIIVGAGNLGMALADYRGFNDNGFQVAALIDIDPNKVGRVSRSGIPVLAYAEMPRVVRERQGGLSPLAGVAPAAPDDYDLLATPGVGGAVELAPGQPRAPLQ